MRIKRCLFIVLFLTSLAASTQSVSADDPPYEPYESLSSEEYAYENVFFTELSAGWSVGRIDNVEYRNPQGAAVITNPVTAGGLVALDNIDRDLQSPSGSVGIGYYIPDSMFFGKLGYHFLGTLQASGEATINANVTSQELYINAHAVMAGIGMNYDLNEHMFVEATAEIGASILAAYGDQGRNLGSTAEFPQDEAYNFAFGGGLGAGFRVSDDVDVVSSGHYYWLGDATTDTSLGDPATGMFPEESLGVKDLSVYLGRVSVRFKF